MEKHLEHQSRVCSLGVTELIQKRLFAVLAVAFRGRTEGKKIGNFLWTGKGLFASRT
jgi:hypothetical protein